MNKEQWNEIRDGILQFNRLVTTPEERKTEAYILKCYDLLDEEYNEMIDEEYKMGEDASIEYLDGVADSIVTAVQLLDALTPSQLEWDYLEEYILCGALGEEMCRFRNHWAWFLVNAIYEGEKEGCDVYGAMLEVNRSNLSKVPELYLVQELHGDNVEEAMKAHSDWIETARLDSEGNPRYKGVFGTVVQDSDGCMRVVFRDENRKVMKSIWFKEPNLAPYIGV